MTDEASFLAAIAENPKDTNLPLIFADWLDDHSDPRGQWIRNHYVRWWMGPKFENPIPKLLEALTKDKHVMSVRRAAAVIGEPIVPGLIELLKHAKPRVRLLTCRCLRGIGPRAKEAVPALMKALSDSDHRVREQAASALAAIGADESAGTEQLKAALTDQNWNVRRTASKVLGAMGAKGSVLEDLVGKLKSKSAKDREEVIEGLAQLGTVDVIPHLDKVTDDADATVRLTAVRALGRLKHAPAASALCRAMRSPHPAVREVAAEQFASYSNNVPVTQEVFDSLITLLADREGRVRAVACSALQQSNRLVPAAVPGLLKNLDHDSADVRSRAALALGVVVRDDAPVIAALTRATADTDLYTAACAVGSLSAQTALQNAVVAPLFAFIERVRADEGVEYHAAAAHAAFGKLTAPPPEVIAELRRALTPRNNAHDLSWSAAQALAALGPHAAPAAPELLRALRQNRLGEPAITALLKMGGAGVDGLIALFDDKDEDVRTNAVNLLWRVGSAGAPLVPALLRYIRKTKDDWRRSRAIYGLQHIGPTATEAIPDLLKYAADADPQRTYTASAALEALAKFGAALVPHLPQLVEMARDPNRANRRGTFAGLFADLAPHTPDVFDPLRVLLRTARPQDSDDWSAQWNKKAVREYAITGFARLGAAAVPAIPDLVPLVADPIVEIRRSVVNLLSTLDPPAVLAPLRQALTDTDETVRVRAAEALEKQADTSKETVAALVHAVDDREAKVRRAAIDALNKLKVSTEPVRKALTEASRDDDKKVAERAAIALRKITPKGAKPADTTTEAEPNEKAPKAKAPKAKGKKKAE